MFPWRLGGTRSFGKKKNSLLFFQNESLRSPIPGVSVPYLRLPLPCFSDVRVSSHHPAARAPLPGPQLPRASRFWCAGSTGEFMASGSQTPSYS